MQLNQLKKGESAMIVKINATKELRDRFNSFGIVSGEEITIIEHSLAKQAIEIAIGSSLIVLRTNEAEKIEVTINKEEK